ncbi:MAG: phosphoglucosamine mutase [Hellea sp.]|nr:phosphoglucosamine mutase [Hellea sp.]
MAATKKYFGTDGIRGRAGEGKLSKISIAKLGLAIGHYLYREGLGGTGGGNRTGSVVLGRDTRSSGLWIEKLLIKGLTAYGINVKNAGVLPTAATSFLTRCNDADMGIMITASHNPAHDNGLKLFGRSGRKLDDQTQLQIEAVITKNVNAPVDIKPGKVTDITDSRDKYIDAVMSSLLPELNLDHLSVVLDCANGAAFETGPEILRRLGVKSLHVCGDQPDGANINLNCGSTNPERLCETVREHRADIGIAMDGDADRLIMCDENGDVLNGDQTMGALTLMWQIQGRLSRPGLVATVMSNLGLERMLGDNGLELIRTPVGDRHVAKAMQDGNYNLGGEQSGHMLMPDYLPTGDGMLAAIQLLSVLVTDGRKASEALQVFASVPQTLINVRYNGKSPLELEAVQDKVKAARAEFGDSGRVLIRASGTEPLIRIMTEGDDPKQVVSIARSLADFISGLS